MGSKCVVIRAAGRLTPAFNDIDNLFFVMPIYDISQYVRGPSHDTGLQMALDSTELVMVRP